VAVLRPRIRAPRGFAAWLLLISFGALLVRLAYLIFVHPDVPRVSDASAYHLLANNLADGLGYIRPFDLSKLGLEHTTAEYPPLFPALLSIWSWFGGRSVDAQRVLTCFIGTGTVVLIGLLGRRVRGEAVGLVAAGIAAIYPMLFMADGVLMAETLFALLVTASLLLAYRAADEPSPARFAVLGVALGLAALTRAEGLVLAVFLVVPLAISLRTLATKRRALLATVGIGVAILVVAPWTIRNAVEFDRFVPVANNIGTAIDGANCPLVYSGDQIGLWRSTFGVEDPSIRPDDCFEGFDVGADGFDEAEASAQHRADGIEYAREHLERAPVVAVTRVLRAFGLFRVDQQIDVESFEGRGRTWQWVGLVMWWLLLPLAIGGILMLRRARERIWPLLSTVAAATVTVVLTYGNQRFRVAAEPAVVVLAAVGVVYLFQRQRGTLAAAGAAGPVPEATARAFAPRIPARLFGRFDTRDVVCVAILLAAFLLPLRGLMRSQGPPMEEGFMLVFPERVLAGDLPNKDFLHLYGPGGLWGLAGFFEVLGTSLTAERLFALFQQMAVVFGVFAIARRWGRTVALGCGLASLLFIVPPIGLTALAWVGAVGLGVVAIAVGAASRDAGVRDPPRAARLAVVTGLLIGAALLFRLDLAVAAGLSMVALGWGAAGLLRKRFAIGLGIGLSPYLIHLITAGPDTVIRGMVLDPVVYLRGGRSLPLPPPLDHFDAQLQRAGNLTPLRWPLPTIEGPAQLTLWFFLLIASVIALAVIAVWLIRRHPESMRARVLLASAAFSVGILPQAIQRADSTHLAWVACVPMALLPVAVLEVVRARRPDVQTRTVAIAAAGTLLVVLAFVIPNFTVRSYTDYSAQTFGYHRLSYPITHDGRTFYYGRKDDADAATELLAELDSISKPGQSLFVGPTDLRRTPYSDAYFYYLIPKLDPGTYYIEMDPGVANADDSGLADEVRNADFLILSSAWDNWDEPNDSRELGSSEPNKVVRDEFCLVDRFGPHYRLYERCDARASNRG